MRESKTKFRTEEQLIPIIRANLAERLSREGFRVNEIAKVLNVTQPAITQYLEGKRGRKGGRGELPHAEEILGPLAEKLSSRFRSNQGGLETLEILEAARQLIIINEERHLTSRKDEIDKHAASVNLLRERLQLEIKAAEKYLELANRASDEHTKLLFRLIASDSLRHGDIVSQIISWLELGGVEGSFQAPDKSVLEQMISLEDSANEVNLFRSVSTGHPIARLLLEWIDMDEEKHEKIVSEILRLSNQPSPSP